ncbi:MAG: 2-C-methyl-D-erythritol 2,4-cyclodiphosphate synthase [Maioricimonas sp. JB045]|uniref:2-C-methyl-D-erythritol 2,4-cyclodiphosphate synthase n=1 Tax=Maioricimonas sp. JC845 TaxID=3232138 RepID=UPI003459B408
MLRVGLGHDTHRLIADVPLMIGGIHIEHERGPDAHSDGDVLLHAVTDALLGAIGMGDIGEWFPDTDPQHAGADSAVLLTQVVQEVHRRGWNVINADCIVFAQKPKLSPYKRAMAERVAGLLEIPADRVNVKAKTGEKVGPIGREEAIAAEVVVLLQSEAE